MKAVNSLIFYVYWETTAYQIKAPLRVTWHSDKDGFLGLIYKKKSMTKDIEYI